jgi:hypothetical protein
MGIELVETNRDVNARIAVALAGLNEQHPIAAISESRVATAHAAEPSHHVKWKLLLVHCTSYPPQSDAVLPAMVRQ